MRWSHPENQLNKYAQRNNQNRAFRYWPCCQVFGGGLCVVMKYCKMLFVSPWTLDNICVNFVAMYWWGTSIYDSYIHFRSKPFVYLFTNFSALLWDICSNIVCSGLIDPLHVESQFSWIEFPMNCIICCWGKMQLSRLFAPKRQKHRCYNYIQTTACDQHWFDCRIFSWRHQSMVSIVTNVPHFGGSNLFVASILG